MRVCLKVFLLAVLIVCTSAFVHAKDKSPAFKTVEAKHFAQAEGVELSPSFGDYFYAELRAELKKAKMAGEIIGEGEAVDDADAPASVVISGTIMEYKKGSVVKSAIIGFGAGLRSLKMDADVLRRSDKQNLCALHIHVKTDPRWNEKVMAKFAAKQLVKHMKSELNVRPK